jgi:hypothetical protein
MKCHLSYETVSVTFYRHLLTAACSFCPSISQNLTTVPLKGNWQGKGKSHPLPATSENTPADSLIFWEKPENSQKK